MVAWGGERGLEARAAELAQAGTGEVVLWPFPAGDDPAGSLTPTLDAMRELAAR